MSTPRPVSITAGAVSVDGDLVVPVGAHALVVFAHGSGSSHTSPRNQQVAGLLHRAGFATLLFDLLTAEEDLEDHGRLRFDIELLASRLLAAIAWVDQEPSLEDMTALGLFGASTGAAAALVAAAELGERVGAVVSRGGRPDLGGDALPKVDAPTLLIVGGLDDVVLGMNEQAATALRCPHRLEIVPGATHLFEEPGALARVGALAVEWFTDNLGYP